MSEFPPEFVVHNQAELEDLAWELEASAGQFSLMLARCNYAKLRSQLIDALRQLCPLTIRVLVLNATETVLYTRIQAELGEPPGALMVVGLETVNHLEQLLSTANQVREEFRKTCPFPIVLWVTDEVQGVLMHAASDLESWATKTHFTLPPQALNEGLEQASDRLFAALLNTQPALDLHLLSPQLDLGWFHAAEVAAAVQELCNQGQDQPQPCKPTWILSKGCRRIIRRQRWSVLNAVCSFGSSSATAERTTRHGCRLCRGNKLPSMKGTQGYSIGIGVGWQSFSPAILC